MDEVSLRQRLAACLAPVGPHTELVGARGDYDLNPDARPAGAPVKLRAAAVLVPIVRRAAGPTVLLTLRTAHLQRHAGQVAFPGGRVEPHDPTPAETALRETEEEIGLDRRHVDVLGRLDVYETVTGFSVTPVVGLVEDRFTLRLDPHEVEDAFEVPLAFLLDPANHQRHSRDLRGTRRYFYAMPYEGRYIWGATAGMIVNLARALSV